jgi:hypothetical protein
MSVAAILPCRGRLGQTVTNVKRLLATAGTDQWRLYAVGGREDSDVLSALAKLGIATFTATADRLTYWQALAEVTATTTEPLIACLANDLLPGMHWLRRAVEAYDQTFGNGPGLIGFNGDSHELDHSCHMLISRDLLARYGGWPTWYSHNFGDTELCQRAIEDRLYAKAPWALLYHDHPYWSGTDDNVYAEGRATIARDQALYNQRQKMGWPNAHSANGARLMPVSSAVITAALLNV